MITTTSARYAIYQATAFGWESRVRFGGGWPGSAPVVAHAVACGAVLAAVERCPAPVQNWLITAYATESYPGVAMAAQRSRDALYSGYLRRHRACASHERLFRFAGAVLCDCRAGVVGAQAAEPSWYARQVGFRVSNWPRWSRMLDRMVSVINEWDRRGLAEVGAVMHLDFGISL